MAKLQTDSPAKSLEEMLADANAQALIDPNACVTCGHNPPHSSVVKLAPQDIDKLENMNREELLVLVKRMAQTTPIPVDLEDAAALRTLAKGALAEIVQTAPRNVSLVGAIRELLDRIDGKAPQSIALDVKDSRMDRLPIDKLLRLASMLDEPVVIAPMPKRIDDH